MVAIFSSASVWILAFSVYMVVANIGEESCLLQQTTDAMRKDNAMRKASVTSSPAGPQEVARDYAGREIPTTMATAAEIQAKEKINPDDHSWLNFHNPKVWGPAAWFFFHSMALAQEDNISAEQQKRLHRFFTHDLPIVLPCPTCGENAKEHISSMKSVGVLDNATFSKRESVAKFVWTLHNMVNTVKNVSHVSWDRSVLNFAQAYDQGTTLLHFNKSNVEVTPAEHDRAELLMAPHPLAVSPTAKISKL